MKQKKPQPSFKKKDSNKMKVWTRQDRSIIDVLEKEGRYIAKKEYIAIKMEDCAKFYFEVYSWYADRAKGIVPKPDDVSFPIWVSLSEDFMLQSTEDAVILELEVDSESVIVMDTDKWDRVVNFWYVPLDESDEDEFERKLKKHDIANSSAAYMSGFYPHLKKEILRSWDRLFDNSYALSDMRQGTIWEIRKEWVRRIIE
jgi:hypothetical protein